MKRSILILTSVFAYLLFSSVSCEEKEPFVNIKAIENQLYNEIKAFRESNGLTGPFVQNYSMIEEAQLFSITLVYSESEVIDSSGISSHWDIIHDKFGGYNDKTLIQITTDATASDIAANWTQDTSLLDILLSDVTQCGIGIETDADQLNYVTMFLMKADSR